jgi:hypothetical protein
VQILEIAQERNIENAAEIEEPFFSIAFFQLAHMTHKDEVRNT